MVKYLFFFFLILLFACKRETVSVIKKIPSGMALIPAGTLHMGGDNEQADPNEFPKHDVNINSFYMDIIEVTNAEFKKFVDATYYLTVAERPIDWEEMKKQLPEVEAIRSGTNTYMTKPVDYPFLIAKIFSVLEYKQKLKNEYIHELEVNKATQFKDEREAEFINDL